MSDGRAGLELASWWTKQEAADRLQTSVRSIERRISTGEIEARKRRKDGPKLQHETVVNPVDIQRLMPAAHVVSTGEPTPAASPQRGEVAPNSTSFYDFFNALLATLATNATTPRQLGEAEKNWLTVEEAAARSGLSETMLKELCKTGQLRALRDGREWKIHRKHLDQFEGGNK